MPKNIIVREVGPRDDLQLFRTEVDRQAKIDWCREEAAAGVCEIEVTSFVPASIIPQFNDAAEVAAGFVRCFHCQAWGMPVRAKRDGQYQYRRLRVFVGVHGVSHGDRHRKTADTPKQVGSWVPGGAIFRHGGRVGLATYTEGAPQQLSKSLNTLLFCFSRSACLNTREHLL